MSGNLFNESNMDTSTKNPWAAQAPYLSEGFQNAYSLLNNRGAYTGPFIGAESPWTIQGRQALAQTANDPNSLSAYSKNMLASTLRGDYLNPESNPYLSAAVSDALGQAKSAFAGQYAGAAGSNMLNTGYQEALARGLGAVATNAYMGNYNAERDKQMQAISAAPTFDTMQANLLFGAGQSEDARRQAEVEAEKAKYMSPWTTLANYLNAIKGDYGATINTPYHTNPFGSALGGAMGIGSLYKMFGGGGGGDGYGSTWDWSGQDGP